MKKMIGELKNRINALTYKNWSVTFINGSFSFKNKRKFQQDLTTIKRQSKSSDLVFPITSLLPCYGDIEDNAGSLSHHYFYQDLFVAQRIHQNNPFRHIDIGSRVDGFVAHVASFRKIEIFDIRPLVINVPNILFKQTNIMDLNTEEEECTDSISCLSALEHFGLGRYGDPICFEGYLIGFNNITKILKKGGIFYFSVPMGQQRIEFHAHRIFSLKYLLEMIEPLYIIKSFSYINDNNIFYPDAEITIDSINSNCDCFFGCAIFELIKK